MSLYELVIDIHLASPQFDLSFSPSYKLNLSSRCPMTKYHREQDGIRSLDDYEREDNPTSRSVC